MSRLTELLARAKAKDAQLGADLEREFRALSSRRAFGLNFERHKPEVVELPGNPVRKGDKVRVLPPRGESAKGDQRLWRVTSLAGKDESRTASLELVEGEPESSEAAIADLVVVAEFRDFIFPGLVSTGRVERGGDKPFHTIINGENFHVLKTLTYTHRGKIDAIYIDPPYNSRAKDWKYNNDYVGEDDLYRHSKWLAMLERRLLIARELLNPKDSVLIVTIDEKEYLRLGMLLEQLFPEANMQMISTLINSKGTGRANEFRRVDEYIYFLWFGGAKLGRLASTSSVNDGADDESDNDDYEDAQGDDELGDDADVSSPGEASIGLDWQTFRRRDLASRRGTKKGGPRQFYPVYVNIASGQIEAIGAPLPHDAPQSSAPQRDGCVPVFPVRKDGTEMNWSAIGPTFEKRWRQGYARAGRPTPDQPQKYIIQYLKTGSIKDIEEGRAIVTGKNADGSVIAEYPEAVVKTPTTQWAFKSHNAEHYGTGIITVLIPGRSFPFPKSLYAVEDALRIFIAEKPNAVVLDYFAGSGTTAHAVMRLNRQDGGRRQCISVTNNEVAADEQMALRDKGLRPGDPKWEQWGICEYITKPRVAAAIAGKTPSNEPLTSDYKFIDEFPMAEGFKENAEFFTLTYETPRAVDHNRAFSRIAPLLWMRAGSRGERVDALPECGWAIAETYGLLTDLDQAEMFCEAVNRAESLTIAYVVTNDDRRFEGVARLLPEGVEPVRLYESYLTNFRFASGGVE